MPQAKSSANRTELLEELIPLWRKSPKAFVTNCFGVDPDPWQVEALDALNSHGRVAIRACHGPGKSAVAAWSVLHFMFTRWPTRVPCTAPTAHQLEDILWAEIGKWLQRMEPYLRGMVRQTSERLEWVGSPKESFAVARTARPESPEALQGFHADNLLFVLDEASGIHQSIFEVAEGALSGPNAKVLMLGNPTRAQGYFFDAFTRLRHRWYTMRVSHDDSPRVTDEYVEDMRAKYGEDSNVFRVRVLGEFPTSDDAAVVSLELAESAAQRDIEQDMDAATVWGLDVARFGDDATALVKRRGPVVLDVKQWRGKDLMQTAGLVYDEYTQEKAPRKPDRICVDSIGLGSGVVDRLKEMGVPVRGVNVAEAPSVKARFMRLRDELWFEAREWFATRAVSIPDDADLIGQITGPTYKMTSAGKLLVESKDDMKKRGIASPDIADALCMTFVRGSAKKRREAKIDYKFHKGVV